MMDDNVILWLSGFLGGVCVTVAICWPILHAARRDIRRALNRPTFRPLRRDPFAEVERREVWQRDPEYWKGDHS